MCVEWAAAVGVSLHADALSDRVCAECLNVCPKGHCCLCQPAHWCAVSSSMRCQVQCLRERARDRASVHVTAAWQDWLSAQQEVQRVALDSNLGQLCNTIDDMVA